MNGATGTRVLVCGSRAWADRTLIRLAIAALKSEDPEAVVIHGDARGADRMAGQFAEDFGLRVERFPAEWGKHGKRAGILRNLAMLDTEPDRVLAFVIGDSPGTRHTLSEAQRRGIPTKAYVAVSNYHAAVHIEESEPIR